MQLTIDRIELLKALKTVGHAIPSRSTLPVLRTFHMTAKSDKLCLAATDLEKYIRQTVSADVSEIGSLCIGLPFAEFIQQTIGDVVTMRTDRNSLVVKCERNQARFPIIDAAEFPAWPEQFTPLCRINAGVVNQVARRVIYATASDQTRPILTGVYIVQRERRLRMAAADGFRLATASVVISNDAEFEATIPASSAIMLSAFQSDDVVFSTPITSITETMQILFSNDSLEVLSQLIMGKFPDVDQVIPTTYDTQGRVKREELLHAARLMRVFAREARNALKLDVGPEQFVVTSEVSEAGDGHSVVDAEFAGKPVQLAVNADYLIDALAALDCEFVVLRFINSKCPLVIRPDRDEDCVAVIMPMNLQEGQCQKA